MPASDAHDSDPAAPVSGTPHTPRVSGEVVAGSASETPLPESSTRAAQSLDEASAVSEPSDTLLSAGKPADRLELLLDDRLGVVDERLRELDQRLGVLEQKKSIGTAPESRQKPWLWIVLLIALVVVFQLLQRIR